MNEASGGLEVRLDLFSGRLSIAAGVIPAAAAAALSPDWSMTALVAFSGILFALLTRETRQGAVVTPLPGVCWLAVSFGGTLPAALTASGVLLSGLLFHWRNEPVRKLFLSLIVPSAMIIAAGRSASPWILLPAGIALQTAALSLMGASGWRRTPVAAANWIANAIAAGTVLFFVEKDGFAGGFVVVAVMALFSLQAAITGSRLVHYSGRIGVLSIENRLLGHFYGKEAQGTLFFHDGSRVWTMEGRPAPGIPSPGNPKALASRDLSVFSTGGSSAFIAAGMAREDLDSLPSRERKETLRFLEAVWRSAFARRRLENAFLGAAGTLVKMADKKDSDTHRHSIRVSQTAVKLGRILGLSEPELFQLKIGAILHDIGKLAIPGSLVMKKGLLTQEERRIIETHPRAGAKLLEPMERYGRASAVVLQHHERIDGTGYPAGLAGNEICLQARIVAVADTFDAIISPRSYHLGKPSHIALREIRKYRGTRYDAVVVDALEEMLR